jgi:hypothetical protein
MHDRCIDENLLEELPSIGSLEDQHRHNTSEETLATTSTILKYDSTERESEA